MVPQGRGTDDPDGGPTPLTALINPVLEALGDERVLGWEGCLSIPGLRGEVPRFHRLRVAGLPPEGPRFEATVSGHRARGLPHERDHLGGVLCLDRITHFRNEERTLGKEGVRT